MIKKIKVKRKRKKRKVEGKHSYTSMLIMNLVTFYSRYLHKKKEKVKSQN